MYLQMRLKFFLLLSMGILDVSCFYSSPEKTNVTCPSGCKCSPKEKKATCSSYFLPKKKFTEIPKFPDYVRSVKLTDCNLRNITKEHFTNLTLIELESLILQETKTKNLDPDAFAGLWHLKQLEINRNTLLTPQMISKSLSSLNKTSISRIRFQNNKWQDLPKEMFQSLRGSEVTVISLRGNELRTVDGQIFSGLGKLEDISFSSNEYIHTVFVKGLPGSLLSLDLSNNNIRDFPKFCQENMNLSKRLQTINLQINQIKFIISSNINCLKNLAKINLNLNQLNRLGNDTFRDLPSLRTLLLSGTCKNIQRIEDFAFRSTSLTKLNFDANVFDFRVSKNYNPNTIFKSCPNLTSLTLEGNILTSNTKLLLKMFIPLKKLKKLILQNVQLWRVPKQVFKYMPSLRELYLSGNAITGWDDDPDVFGNITWLNKLVLHSNKIRTINKTSFPPELLSSLKHIDLGINEYACNCDLMWFRDWIRKNKSLIIDNWPKKYVCRSPPNMNQKLLKNYNPTAESCRESNPIITVAVVLSIFCVSMAIAIVVLYKSRWHIRYWIYLLRAKKKGYESIPGGEGYLYDSFVIYSEDDRQWVHEKLIPKMEEENNYTLCVHYRDFGVGKLIVDNITDSINQSRKVLVVLSNSFARSEWCQFELKISQRRFLNDYSNMLVLVMLEEIDNKHLTSSLRALITTTTYAVWTRDSIGQIQCWDQLVTALAH